MGSNAQQRGMKRGRKPGGLHKPATRAAKNERRGNGLAGAKAAPTNRNSEVVIAGGRLGRRPTRLVEAIGRAEKKRRGDGGNVVRGTKSAVTGHAEEARACVA